MNVRGLAHTGVDRNKEKNITDDVSISAKRHDRQSTDATRTSRLAGEDVFESLPDIECFNNYSRHGTFVGAEIIATKSATQKEAPTASEVVSAENATVTETAPENITAPKSEIDRMVEKMRENSAASRYHMLAELLRKDNKEVSEFDVLDVYRKCLKIAMRIMRGGKVHDADLRFLLQNDPGLYFQAMLLRQPKENPEEHERITEDESEQSNESSVTGDGGTASADAAGADTPDASVAETDVA